MTAHSFCFRSGDPSPPTAPPGKDVEMAAARGGGKVRIAEAQVAI